jgi:hypothetical protein
VLEVLKDREINVLAAESSSIEKQRLHFLEIICDGKEFKSAYYKAAITAEDRMSELRRAVLTNLFFDITFDYSRPSSPPQLEIRRIETLASVLNEYERADRSFRNKELPIRPARGEASIQEDGSISVPHDILESPQQSVRRPKPSTNEDFGQYLTVSDTRDRLLRVFFFRKSDNVISFNVEHVEKRGAIAAITAALGEARFNIITMVSRLYEHGTQASTEFVVSFTGSIGSNGGSITENLERALSTPALINEYKIALRYPKSYGDNPSSISLPSPQEEREIVPQGNRRHQVQTTLTHLAEIDRGMRAGGGAGRRSLGSVSQDVAGNQMLSDLKYEEEEAGGIPRKRRLFLSHTKASQKLADTFRKMASKKFQVVTGFDPSGGTLIRDKIINLIRQSDCFLGLWSELGGNKTQGKERWWPSPWLHWELGVAQATEKRSLLLLSENIDENSWQSIYGEIEQTVFDNTNFESQCRAALQSLLQDERDDAPPGLA